MNTKKKLAFASADIFGGGSVNIINFLYPGFLALVIGLSPYLCGLIMLITRVWDAFTDPMMGVISDRTKSKFGKRRLYLIIGAPLVFITFFFLFFPFSFNSTILRFLIVLLSYIAFSTVQTLIAIPYQSLSGEISKDYKERASYNSIRRVFNVFASILAVGLPPIIIKAFENQSVLGFDGTFGYLVMTVLLGTIFAVSVLITGVHTREEIVSKPSTGKVKLKEFVEPLKIKSFRHFLCMSVAIQMTIAVLAGCLFFFVNFYLVRDLTANSVPNSVGSLAAVVLYLTQIFAIPFYLKLIKKKNKAYIFKLGSAVLIASCLLILFLKPGSPTLLLYLIAALIGFGISGACVAPIAMFGDVADVIELKMGSRQEGVMSGLMNFFNKVAQAVGVAIMMAILGLANFASAEPGTIVLSQPESAQVAMLLIMGLSPIITLGWGIYFAYKYKIDQDKHKDILKRMQNVKDKNVEKESDLINK